MSVFAPGSLAVVKIGDDRNGDRFVLLHVDPTKSTRPGYMFTEGEPMTEVELRFSLAEGGLNEFQTAALMRAAREQWDASQ